VITARTHYFKIVYSHIKDRKPIIIE